MCITTNVYVDVCAGEGNHAPASESMQQVSLHLNVRVCVSMLPCAGGARRPLDCLQGACNRHRP